MKRQQDAIDNSNDRSQDRTELILGNYFDGDFRVYPMAENQVSPEQIESIGKRYGVVYPQEFIAHVSGRFPGAYVEVKEEIWPRPKPYDVGPSWSFLYALHTYTADPASEDWMRLDIVAAEFQNDTGLIAAPVLKIVGDADLYCVDSQGHLMRFNHELGELSPVDLDFWELFEFEIAELKARKLRKVSGE